MQFIEKCYLILSLCPILSKTRYKPILETNMLIFNNIKKAKENLKPTQTSGSMSTTQTTTTKNERPLPPVPGTAKTEVQPGNQKENQNENQKKRSYIYAKSSPFYNNCGLHGIIHTWLSLPRKKQDTLFEFFPIFTKILERFYLNYDLPGTPDRDHFFKIMEVLKNPLDRELVLGPVMREILCDLILPEIEMETFETRVAQDCIDNQIIGHDILAFLLQEMGANMNLYNAVKSNREYVAVKTLSKSPFDAIWEVKLQYQGGHYDFRLPTGLLCIEHNERREFPDSLIYSEICQELMEGYDMSDTVKQSVQIVDASLKKNSLKYK